LPYYAFDAIPLEVISTIYEQSSRRRPGEECITRRPVADLLLDSVLPWQ
jgi:hypothetical protein